MPHATPREKPLWNALPFVYHCLFLTGLLLSGSNVFSQYPASCASVNGRANSNGQANSCPNVSGTAYASNFTGTSYATVPASSKTGNITFKYTGATTSLKPFAITKVWQTNPSTTVLPISFGPAGVPTVSGSDILVNYCFYGSNMPSLGTLSFQLTNPETNAVWGVCSFDATCTSNCTIIANPSALPVVFGYFNAKESNNTVQLNWTTEQEVNCRGFGIERSIDTGSFTTIGFVASSSSQGLSDRPTEYYYKDNVLPAGAVAGYRVREVDMDGRFSYSAVQTVHLDSKNTTVQVWGGSHQITISFPGNSPGAAFYIAVYDVQGRLLAEKNITALKTYSINGLPGSGKLYYVHVTGMNASFRYTKAVYVQ